LAVRWLVCFRLSTNDDESSLMMGELKKKIFNVP
jgi:hypothetical protein